MKMIFAASLALGVSLFGGVSQAQVSVRVPGVAIEAGPQPYWIQNRDREAEWRRRSEFRETEYRRAEWLRDHCVRDWSGHEFCRR